MPLAMRSLLGDCGHPVGERRGSAKWRFLQYKLDFPEGPDLVDMAALASHSSARFLFMDITTDDPGLDSVPAHTHTMGKLRTLHLHNRAEL